MREIFTVLFCKIYIMSNLKTKVLDILNKNLPNCAYRAVTNRVASYSGSEYLKIEFAMCERELPFNGRPQQCSFVIDKELNLSPQMFGGCGGRTITRKPNKLNENEKWLACKSVPVPFRKPKKVQKNVLAALERFILLYCKMLKENRYELVWQDTFINEMNEFFEQLD